VTHLVPREPHAHGSVAATEGGSYKEGTAIMKSINLKVLAVASKETRGTNTSFSPDNLTSTPPTYWQ
jgi:hypothetical protein